MVTMQKLLVISILVLLGVVSVLAQNPPNWHDVRSIARMNAGGYYYASLGKAPGNPFDSLFVVYAYPGFNDGYLFGFKRSPNVGVTFSESLRVMQAQPWRGGLRRHTAIAHDAHGIHVVLSASPTSGPPYQGVYYLRSTDGGNSWSQLKCLDSNGWTPALTVDSYGINVFWVNGGHIYCNRFNFQSGTWWMQPKMVDGLDLGCDDPQAVAIQYLGGGGAPVYTLYAVYSYLVNDIPSVKCRSSLDFGVTWTTETLNVPVFQAVYYPSPAPALAARDGVNNVYVLYTGTLTTSPTRFRVYCSKVGGGNPVALTQDMANVFDQHAPRLVLGLGDTLHAVWMDDRVNPGVTNEIYYDRSSDGGQSWIEKPIGNRLISRNEFPPIPPYQCALPDIISDGIHQVVVWDSLGSGSYSLMYRKRTQDNQAPAPPTGLQVFWGMVGVELYWTGVPDAAGYNVYRADGVMPPLIFQKITPQPVPDPHYSDASADPFSCYTYYVTAVDAGENESQPSEYAFYYGCAMGDQLASVDVGDPTPSPNTVRRAGFFAWGNTPDSTVDYDPDRLVYRFAGLSSDSSYLLGVGYFENSPSRLREQSLFIDGMRVHGRSLLPGKSAKMVYLVPKSTFRDGVIEVSLVRERGPNAVAAQLWLYKTYLKGGGPQSAGVVDLKGAKARLYDPAPNPASGNVEVSFALASHSRVSLGVYNISGQKVHTLLEQEKSPGRYTLTWNRKDDTGQIVPGGVYFFRLQVGDAVFTKRITLLR